MEGENYYSKADVLNGKKYFASPKQFAWEVDGKFYGYEVMLEGSIHPHVTENIIEISNSIIEKGRKPLSVWKTAISKL